MTTFKCYPARRLRGTHHNVEILAVKSPSRIYIHLEDPDGIRAKLLTYFAGMSLTHPEVHPLMSEEAYEGAPVYVRCDGRFYRGVVERERDEDGDILVWLGDWALTLITNQEELFTIPQAHKAVPFQAVACGMHEVDSGVPWYWPEEAVDLMKGVLEEGSTWTMAVRDRDTGSDGIWVDFLPEDPQEATPREILIGTGLARARGNPGWFDWGADAGFFCDQTQLPHHYRLSRGPGREESDSEEEGAWWERSSASSGSEEEEGPATDVLEVQMEEEEDSGRGEDEETRNRSSGDTGDTPD